MEIKPREVVWSEIAKENLQLIYEYGVETFSVNASNVFIDELIDATDGLSENFLAYPECRHL